MAVSHKGSGQQDSAGAQTAYDEVPYISGARAATSIDRLASLGRLLGIATADPHACRVLELGCGDGGNLIPMAISFPGSEFVGIDLAPTAIERGRLAVGELGVGNVSLLTGAFADVDASYGAFDYVIAHGIYSWVPPSARDDLLAAVRQRMMPDGIAFVSYNALPGSHIRGVLREMMVHHTRHITDPATKIAEARGLLSMLMQAPAQAGDVYRPLLQSDVGIAMRSSDYLLYHDDLADVNQPFFFGEFMADAHRHGLQFAAEANFSQMSTESVPAEVAEQLNELGSRDILAKEQYLDFMTCRSFRQTLLCHKEVQVDRQVTLDRVRELRMASDARETSADPASGAVGFSSPNTSALRTDHSAAIAALRMLGAAFPRSIPFDDLAVDSGVVTIAEAETLAEVLYRAATVGLVSLHVSEPPAVFAVSERPLASAWARRRASSGRVVNLYHESLTLGDGQAEILELLDGAHTLAGIATALACDESAIATEIADFAAKGLLLG
ncbi:hypothetical protein AYO38_11065 [bacterium SCGC AG-212-C10]|nr:hypothetical protein AYO38_11065 [bacterium SCGC AG-212-C10]